MQAKRKTDTDKLMKNKDVIQGDSQQIPSVNVAQAESFVKLLDDNQLFVTQNGSAFFFISGGICYSTSSFNLKWDKFYRMVERGFEDFRKTYSFQHSIDYDKKGFANASWKKRELGVRQKFGNFSLLSAEWCACSDFNSREVLEKACNEGFLTARDMRSAEKNNFNIGPLYYFALDHGFKTPADAKKALEIGTNSIKILRMFRRGKFKDVRTAQVASEKGFTKLEDWDDARQRGCSTMKELRALKKYGWATVQEYNRAKNYGFQDNEHPLYEQLSTIPCFNLIWTKMTRQSQNFQQSKRNKSLLKLIRQHPKLLRGMEKYDLHYLWKAAIIHRLEMLSEKQRISLENLREIGHLTLLSDEKISEKEFQEFIYHHPTVHLFGSAIPADGMFEIRTRVKVDKKKKGLVDKKIEKKKEI